MTDPTIYSAIGLAALGMGVSIGAAASGSGIGQGISCAAVSGAYAETGDIKQLIFAVLPETQAIYGLVIAILIYALVLVQLFAQLNPV